MKLFPLFVQTALQDTARACWTALLGVNLGVPAVDDTLYFRFSYDTFLTAARDAGLDGAGPGHRTIIGLSIQLTTFASLTAGSRLFDHQSTVLRHQGTLLLFTVCLPLQTDAGDARVVRYVGYVEHLSFVLADGFCTCN